MKTQFTLTGVVIALALCPPLIAQVVTPSALINFGSLYGNGTPTTVISSTTPVATPLIGESLFWACLDNSVPSPENSMLRYNISQNNSILTYGQWGGFTSTEKNIITAAATNMFYSNQELLISSATNQATAKSYQEAVWLFFNETQSYTGDLSQGITYDLIDYLYNRVESAGWLNPDDPNFSPMLGDFLTSALTPAGNDVAVYFGNPILHFNYQPSIFFHVVPEPSSLLLGSVACSFALLIRRRLGSKTPLRSI